MISMQKAYVWLFFSLEYYSSFVGSGSAFLSYSSTDNLTGLFLLSFLSFLLEIYGFFIVDFFSLSSSFPYSIISKSSLGFWNSPIIFWSPLSLGGALKLTCFYLSGSFALFLAELFWDSNFWMSSNLVSLSFIFFQYFICLVMVFEAWVKISWKT